MHPSPVSRILLVEDERDISDCIVNWLKKEPYVVDAAYDGLDALTKLNSRSYDLIILDVMLPFLDGIEICSRARAQGYILPIVVMSARASQSTMDYALKSGANLFITKPFKLNDLSACLSRLLPQQNFLPCELPSIAFMSGSSLCPLQKSS